MRRQTKPLREVNRSKVAAPYAKTDLPDGDTRVHCP